MYVCFYLIFFFSELYEKDFSGQVAIYWEVKYPFPLSNRDVSFWSTLTILVDKQMRALKAFPFEHQVWFIEVKSGYNGERVFPKTILSQSVFPNSSNLSTCTWGSGETWMWTAGRSGWSWPEVLQRHSVQRRVACCGSKTTSRAWPWRAMEPVELQVTRDEGI